MTKTNKYVMTKTNKYVTTTTTYNTEEQATRNPLVLLVDTRTYITFLDVPLDTIVLQNTQK